MDDRQAIINKKYYEDHKEAILARHRNYQKVNKVEISHRLQEKIVCECGCIVTRASMPNHKRTFKHSQKLQSINQ